MTYTPNANFSGTDFFTFKAKDGTVDSTAATIAITVTPAPTVITLDQSHLTTDSNASTASFGQSFTAGLTGGLARINVGMTGDGGSGTLNIYEGGIGGSGVPGVISGSLLHSQAVTWSSGTGLKSFDLTPHFPYG